ncbi:MAG: ribosome small subunit-dependent GTPase A [Oscillospiraceae bacterium]|nr:ribosome small subunit-dependent GTPase A [Oscillospiraceae bacterium]
MEGLIIKAVGGLYTVESPDGSMLPCRARGIFRRQGISPCAGDRVRVENECITEIFPRKNQLIRPPLANLDKLIFVLSVRDPAPNLQLLDRFLAVCVYKSIEPVLVFTKVDLADSARYAEIYSKTGFPVYDVDYRRPETLRPVYDELEGAVSAFTGNSGVGKSTLLNALDVRLQLETADISKKLGRGRHTTRETALYTLPNGGRVADTPGFSTFETEAYAQIAPEELAGCFPELRRTEAPCRYADCRHLREPGCAVRAAVEAGEIPQSRYESYTEMLTGSGRQCRPPFRFAP